MSAGCIRSITQRARRSFFCVARKKHAKNSSAQKNPTLRDSLRKRKFAKFAHALGLSVAHCETLESSLDRQQSAYIAGRF